MNTEKNLINEGRFTLGDYGVWLIVKQEVETIIRALPINNDYTRQALVRLASPDLTLIRVFNITGHCNLFEEPLKATSESIERLTKWALDPDSILF